MSHHLKSLFRASLGLLLLLGAAQPAAAQLRAVGGGRGIYVYAALQPAGPWLNAAATVVRVERQPAGAATAAFVPVAALAAPAAGAEFVARVLRYNRQLPVPLTLAPAFLQRLGRAWERTHRLDSLRAYSQLLPVQQALGLVYFDSTAQRGTAYAYRLTPVLAGGAAGGPVVTGRMSWPGRSTGGTLRRLPTLASEKQVVVRWQQLEGPQRAVYAQLLRQDDARGEWRPAAAQLTLQSYQKTLALAAYDQQVQPVHAYRYTLRTYDLHGNPGPAADTVLAASYDFLDAGVLRDFRAQPLTAADGDAGIRLSWRLPDANKLRSVRVYRSTLSDKDFKLLAEVNPTQAGFLDATAEPMQKYYYYVQPTGLLQEPGVASSKVFALFEDFRQPLPPHEIRAAAVPAGIRLRWLPGDTFTKGYYVYRAAGPTAPLTLIGALRPHQEKAAEQVFVDSSRTLQPELRYRYAVQAENSSHVQSVLSDTTEAAPGPRRATATTAHAVPAVAGAEARWEDGQPLVRWEAPAGAMSYVVSRRVAGGAQAQVLPLGPRLPGPGSARRPLTQPAFRDSTARPGLAYEYEIVAVDEQGQRSAPARLILSAGEATGLVPATLTAAATGQAVELRWAVGAAAPQYRLYRYEPGTKPQAVATVAARPATYRDATVQPRRTYFYYVVSLDAQRHEAGRSEVVGVRVP